MCYSLPGAIGAALCCACACAIRLACVLTPLLVSPYKKNPRCHFPLARRRWGGKELYALYPDSFPSEEALPLARLYSHSEVASLRETLMDMATFMSWPGDRLRAGNRLEFKAASSCSKGRAKSSSSAVFRSASPTLYSTCHVEFKFVRI